MKIGSCIAAATAFLAAIYGSPVRAAPSDTAEIVAVVQGFLDAMARRDAAAALELIVPGGHFTSIRDEGGKPLVKSFDNKQNIESWPASKEDVLERIWNPEVRVHGRMAILTAPYDFHIDGAFSHCGVDVIQLFKTAEGWRIAGGAYTVEKEGCPASPLGPAFAALPACRERRRSRSRACGGLAMRRVRGRLRRIAGRYPGARAHRAAERARRAHDDCRALARCRRKAGIGCGRVRASDQFPRHLSGSGPLLGNGIRPARCVARLDENIPGYPACGAGQAGT